MKYQKNPNWRSFSSIHNNRQLSMGHANKLAQPHTRKRVGENFPCLLLMPMLEPRYKSIRDRLKRDINYIEFTEKTRHYKN